VATANRPPMAWQSGTDNWGGIDDRTTVMRLPREARRPRTWPSWLLTVLAFVCGALVSAAVFTIGWRHQTQQNAAAQSALAAATAHNHKLTASLTAAQAAVAQESRIVARAHAYAQTARASGATIAAQASAAQADATSVTGNTASMASAAGKISTELKTLMTYLTTTAPQQLDSGYIDSQAAYLAHQLDALQSEGGAMSTASSSFDTAIQKLSHLASALSAQK
jgi:hypothetical protein